MMIERLLGDGRGLERLEEVTAHVREAGRAPPARDLLHVVVAAVAIDEQHVSGARGALEERLGRRPRATVREDVRHVELAALRTMSYMLVAKSD